MKVRGLGQMASNNKRSQGSSQTLVCAKREEKEPNSNDNGDEEKENFDNDVDNGDEKLP
jgi:hypothetical protein